MPLNSRWKILLIFTATFLILLIIPRSPIYYFTPWPKGSRHTPATGVYRRPDCALPTEHNGEKFQWACVPQKYPVSAMKDLPPSVRNSIPKIQASFKKETGPQRKLRMARLDAVKGNFTHAWEGYKSHAWLRDEVMPLSGRPHDPFGGWAATLVDSLDTLWIMNMQEEFQNAVSALEAIDFSSCSFDEINVFETTIRYLGGFLSAYDLSDGKYPVLLQKAGEMGDMLYKAFDTPNRLPITRWNFKAAAAGAAQEAGENVLVAEIGSLTLEFTRLSQLTGDPRYFDAVQRIMDFFDVQQARTNLPGMWSVVVNARKANFTEGTAFTIGGMADSLYEYLPKQHILLGGGTNQYRRLYQSALVPMKQHIFYRPMIPGGNAILFPGQTDSSNLKTEPQAQHLGCFSGGMVALAAKAFGNAGDMETARQLVEGCLWGYEHMPQGLMPEIMHLSPCDSQEKCDWNEQVWKDEVNRMYGQEPEDVDTKIKNHHLPQGVTKIDDRRYILRPETIESVFILYRLTGDTSLLDRAWNLFNSIIKPTITNIAHAALDDCTVDNPPKADRMESFWLAETLKYFYLIFSEPNLISLDDFVLNTEAHPLRRPA